MFVRGVPHQNSLALVLLLHLVILGTARRKHCLRVNFETDLKCPVRQVFLKGGLNGASMATIDIQNFILSDSWSERNRYVFVLCIN